tara:strand:+ start:197 stop:313 length:117 start_codon:yes stop_codon:yes gene_type:complete
MIDANKIVNRDLNELEQSDIFAVNKDIILEELFFVYEV